MAIWDARNCAASEGWCAISTMRRKEWHSLHWQKWFSQSQTVRSSSSHAVLPNIWESNLVSRDSEVDSNLAASYLVIFLSFLVMAIWQYHAILCNILFVIWFSRPWRPWRPAHQGRFTTGPEPLRRVTTGFNTFANQSMLSPCYWMLVVYDNIYIYTYNIYIYIMVFWWFLMYLDVSWWFLMYLDVSCMILNMMCMLPMLLAPRWQTFGSPEPIDDEHQSGEGHKSCSITRTICEISQGRADKENCLTNCGLDVLSSIWHSTKNSLKLRLARHRHDTVILS